MQKIKMPTPTFNILIIRPRRQPVVNHHLMKPLVWCEILSIYIQLEFTLGAVILIHQNQHLILRLGEWI